MAFRRAAAVFLVLAAAGGSAVTPVEKVITLLEDLKAEVEENGVKEGATYDEFACFCKDTNSDKTDSILELQDTINSLSAEIGDKTATKDAAEKEKGDRTKAKEDAEKKLADTTARCAKQQAEYEQEAQEMSKAISIIERAIKALEDAKPGAGSFLQLPGDLRASVEQSLALADSLSLIDTHKKKVVSAFLQGGASVDPNDPEYKYHSQPIIDILEKLLTEYRNKKAELDAEWEKTKAACEEMKGKLSGEIEEQDKMIQQLAEHISTLEKEIANAREQLVNAETSLKEDQLYLKDLTKQCEDRAADWDQRSQMRAGELAAITKALEVLKERVLPKEGARAMLIQTPAHEADSKSLVGLLEDRSLSFLQVDSPRARVLNLLERARGSLSTAEAAKGRAVDLLAAEGRRLQSAVLSSLAARAAADPFIKVKKLIQQLIERLLREAEAEALKKGFCDTELGKAESNRDYRWADVKSLSAELAGLEAKEDTLTNEVEFLTDKLKDNAESLSTATKLREDDKAENTMTLKEAQEGLKALMEAIDILKTFYKQAAKGKVFLEASPVDEDTSGPGFKGAYKGSQEKSNAIIGLLEVIKSDFERTIKKTEAAEAKAHGEFTEFDRSSKADSSGKDMSKKLNSQDLATTKTNIKKKMKDLKMNMDLLDTALQELEDLKPTCIDTGMSYEERVAKREQEMEALKKALCILDTDGVEPDCK